MVIIAIGAFLFVHFMDIYNFQGIHARARGFFPFQRKKNECNSCKMSRDDDSYMKILHFDTKSKSVY